MSDTLTVPRELETKTRSLESDARALVVSDEASYRAANAFGSAAKALLAEIDAAFDPVIDAAHKAHKAAVAAKKKQAEPVEAAKKIVADKMGAWYRAEQRRIAEERAKREAEARRQAEEDALRAAEALAAEGMHAAADMALSAPVIAERVEVEEAPKLDGVSYRETWKAEVVSLIDLVRAVAAGTQPLAYLKADETALNQAARLYKNTQSIPGVIIRSETVQSRRA